ncbi:MAG: alpha/beta fold hydrolase [Deltaproteobacteria bacterium]|nr:alpha/beta fold hydrolase [Deltaproteobacteria bacterium]
MRTVHHLVPDGDGWLLSLSQTWHPEQLRPALRPVVIVPGYGMNSFIYSYHPTGVSLEGYLAEAGLEVWRADLRAQGRSMSTGGGDDYALEDLALTDLGAALAAVLERTRTQTDRVDALGGSLGGTLVLAHACLRPDNRLATLVCMGSPVRWEKVHPLVKLAFASPFLAGLVRLRGTRRIAEVALPFLARRTPWLLSVYMNPEITDVSAAREMVRTVEDPNRHVNRQIARWIRDRDLILEGINVSDGLARVTNPLLCVLALGDGIVPPATAAWPFHHVGSVAKRLVEVGSRTVAMAHADMFVSDQAHERVFQPIRDWLLDQQVPRAGESAQRIE